MLGHILRGRKHSPAYLPILSAILSAYFYNAETDVTFKRMLGRPSLNLLDMIRNDLKRKKIFNSVRSISDFEDFTMRAITRKFFEKSKFYL